ncbi:MAG: amidohydrolase [Xanthomonadaceae bacterium]|nr:amidohydrolase [Xanthomonadaceae bacterium]
MKRSALILSAVLALPLAACQHTANRRVGHDAVRAQTDDIYGKLVGIRRDLHKHPELAGDEVRTSATIVAHLRELGLEVQTGLYGHSVVGILRGAHPGKTIAWRADLDALPGDVPDTSPFKSRTPGVHHGCGHDVHVAIALGLAEMLARHRESLHGTAIFVFQPEEETFRGAKALVERGVFAAITPDEIYGLHVTALPVGQILVRPGEMFAYQRRVSIRMKNGLSAEETERLTTGIQSALFRTRPGAKPWELQQAADPAIGLASPTTAFQDYSITNGRFDSSTENGDLLLETDLYETNAENLAGIIPRIERAIDESGYGRQRLSVSFVQANPTVMNDETLTRGAIRTLQRSDGKGAITLAYGQAPFFNDDFAYFQEKVPGVYFFLGGSNIEKGIIAMNHTPTFQVDEESIRIGVIRFSTLLLARLGALDEATLGR